MLPSQSIKCLRVKTLQSVIVHYQEIALKGRNRPWFVKRLTQNLRDALCDLDITKVQVLIGRIEVVLGPRADWMEVRERIGRLFGIANFSRARKSDRDIQELTKAILNDLLARNVNSFRVTARRADKSYQMTSPDIEKHIGKSIKDSRGWKVDLTNPELVVRIEILPQQAFYSLDRYPGQGGLPSGSSGHVVCLLSGGIDSPVAAYRLMKRGCRVRFVHFHSYPLLSRASQDKVREIVSHLTRYQLISRLYLVPFSEIQRQILLSAPSSLRVLLYRRLMMRIAEEFAKKIKAGALVTGESVGQVASQTLENLAVINRVTSLPTLQPLIGFDKEEISNEAKTLGTYPISIIPDQDCCQLFTPRHPATRARLSYIEEAESKLPIDEMINCAVSEAVREDFQFPTKKIN